MQEVIIRIGNILVNISGIDNLVLIGESNKDSFEVDVLFKGREKPVKYIMTQNQYDNLTQFLAELCPNLNDDAQLGQTLRLLKKTKEKIIASAGVVQKRTDITP